MLNSLKIKNALIIIFSFFVILITLANFVNLGKISDKKIKFGVDVKKGKEILLEINSNLFIKNKLYDLIDELKQNFKENKIRAVVKIRKDLQEEKESDFYIQILVRKDSDIDNVKNILNKLKKEYISNLEKNIFDLKLKSSVIKKINKNLSKKTIKVLEKRFFGKNNFIFKEEDNNKIIVLTSNEDGLLELQ
jgi:preprotein translocase subunit SecD